MPVDEIDIENTDPLQELADLQKWDESLPDEDVTSLDGPYKVRSGWFQHVSDAMYLLKQDGRLDDIGIEAVDAFHNEFTAEEFHNRGRTTQAHLDRADELIRQVLEHTRPT